MGQNSNQNLLNILLNNLVLRTPIFPPATPVKWKIRIQLFKDYICKFSIDSILELNQLLPYATAAFNWFPSEHSWESPHFLYFDTTILTGLATFLQPKLRYLGSDEGMTHL